MAASLGDLTREHIGRLREFRKFTGWFSDGPQLGLPLDSPIDEFLATQGFLSPGGYPGGGWILSDEGRSVLEHLYIQETKRRQPHHDLANRVATWLERLGRRTWLNCSFDVATRNDLRAVKHLGLMPSPEFPYDDFLGPLRYKCRPDVISIFPTARPADFQPWIVEVKVSRADFFRDVDTPEKRLAYALLADRVYYACPSGLVEVDEVPQGCGLLVEMASGSFETLREPPRCKTRLSSQVKRLLRSSRR